MAYCLKDLQGILGPLEDLICEYQIDSAGLEEYGYTVTNLDDPRVIGIIGLVSALCPNFPQYLAYPLETISYHPPDGMSYQNGTFVAGFSMHPPAEILTEFGVPDGNYHDGFGLKFDIVTGDVILKLCDKDMHKYRSPKLPLFTLVGKSFGVGVHFSRNPHPSYGLADFYVANPLRMLMRRFLGKLYPAMHEDFIPLVRAYGLTTRDGVIIKAKRYLYWKDKRLLRLFSA